MNESILTSIKKLLNIDEDDTNFDSDIIIHINSVFAILNQLGVKIDPFSIEDDRSTWADYLGERSDLSTVKTYVYLKVKLIFDPPTSSVVMESIKMMISEFEWRIMATVDPPATANTQT